MSCFELLIIAMGLSMDAFGVAVCKGLSVKKLRTFHSLTAGLYFGCFQALMPLIGYFLGMQFEEVITDFDHWIAFALLALIGVNMIRGAMGNDEDADPLFSPSAMLPMALATSIDALAVGVTFALSELNVIYAVSVIGVTTFIFSALGVKIGNIFGAKYKAKAEILGGLALILIGIKILLEDIGILPDIF